MARETLTGSSCVPTLSLSLGERAGMRASVLLLLTFLCLLLFCSPAFAHELRPAHLKLRQTGPGTYDVLWKVAGHRLG